MTQNPNVLAIEGVSAGYGAATVLRGIDLVVPAGSKLALLGPNGAGKTTLLRVAAGLLSARSGSVSINGQDVTRHRSDARAGAGLCLIPEGRGVFRELTVRENLRLMTPAAHGKPDLDRVTDAFPVLGKRMDQLAGSMSGGEQQMLALSRCWLAKPQVVLLDEVSMGLAPLIVDEIFLALGRLAAEGVALVIVEQYVDRALELADRVQLLVRGETRFSGPASDLDRDAVLSEYLGAASAPGAHMT